MAASVEATYGSTLFADETVAFGLDNAADKPIRHELTKQGGVLDASSTPPATKAFSDDVVIGGGATTDIDLTSLDGGAGRTIDFSGLKVQLAMFVAPATNTAMIIVSYLDTSTGYQLFAPTTATAAFIALSPGESAGPFFLNDKHANVDSTHKDLRFTGGPNDVMGVLLVAG